MKLAINVAAAARHFGGSSEEFAKLLQAVVLAEGNILKAVQCTYPTIDREDDALDILARSAVHAMADFIAQAGAQDAFIRFWAKKWAPVGAANDKHNLNLNWPGNVLAFWRQPVDASA